MNNTSSVTLEKIKVAAQTQISERLLDDSLVDAELIARHVVHNFELSLHGYLYGKRIKSIDIEYPTTWWDAFKLRWFPGWLLARYPADMTRVHYQADILLPNAHKALNLQKRSGFEPSYVTEMWTTNYLRGDRQEPGDNAR